MRINRLRGNVADQPIDSQVVQNDTRAPSTMESIVARQPEVNYVEVTRRPTYTKGCVC
jgi:hypothetical protein